ncbi:MAG: heparan-alpha-glucosaminide N-acetyltransferase domain-containing protein [Candidatus Hodarchaeota archaeon]
MNGIVKNKKLPRFDSLDIYRGYLIIHMMLYHYLDWIYYPLKDNLLILILSLISIQMGIYPIYGWICIKENIFGKLSNMFAYLGTLPFMIIVGISLVLSVEIRKERGQTDERIKEHMIKRFLWINLFNLLLAQIILGPGTLFMIGALSIIAFNLLLGYFLMHFSKLIKGIIAVLAYIFTPFIKQLLNIPEIGYYINPDGILGGILTITINLLIQYLPAISFTLFGILLGEFLVEYYRREKLNNFVYLLLACGVFFFIIAYSVDPYREIFGLWHILEPLKDYTLLYSAAVWCFAYCILFWLMEIKKMKLRALQIFKLGGRVTLTLFILHHFIGLNFIMYPNYPFNNDLHPFSFFEIWFGMYLLIWIALSLWSRVKYKYSLEWIIQKYS